MHSSIAQPDTVSKTAVQLPAASLERGAGSNIVRPQEAMALGVRRVILHVFGTGRLDTRLTSA